MSETNRILVGIDGGEGALAALRYAAAEAARSGDELWLVHLVPPAVAPGPMYPHVGPEPTDPRSDLGMAALERAAREATTTLPRDRVTTTLVHGGVVEGLVQMAGAARLVVLGRPHRTTLERIFTGSVVNRVAGHAPSPVTVVPAEWPSNPGADRVVVAVKDCDDAAGLVARAMSEAAARGAELVILHGWEVPVVYDGIPLTRTEIAEGDAASRQELERTLDRARHHRSAPATLVETRVEVRHGQPARLIADAAADADLLVIGRRRHSFPVGRLGNTGRALLRESQCPVEVLPPVLEFVAEVPHEGGAVSLASEESAVE